MSKTIITLTDFSTAQDLDTYSTNPAKELNDYLPNKWLNDALTFSDAWNELELIDWGYWFNLLTWKSEYAAHLYFGIEPISVKREDIPEELNIKIQMFTYMAENRQKNNLSPREWLEWGAVNKFQSVGGIKNALLNFIPNKETESNEQTIEVIPPKPISKLIMQQREIIRLIELKGHDPKSLPRPPKGKSGIKAQIYNEALKNKQLFTPSAFKKSWDSLRAEELIIDQY
jgi:hypothetical protein